VVKRTGFDHAILVDRARSRETAGYFNTRFITQSWV